MRLFAGFALFLILFSCSGNFTPEKFEKSVWMSNNSETERHNPRSRMTQDLLENYLKPGINRDSILGLLGPPSREKIEIRIPKGIEFPDSLSLSNPENFKPENREKAQKNYNEWFLRNGQPDTLMFYPVGWSTIDPNSLVIKFSPDSISYEFWIEQH
ncbi:hypothetical protein [Algoriphagus confluentis]|uniref:Lipoprotein n=1 Tax=Algoriphagus confluentis TaxID=1697556 RepID=A0ABQ6PLJ2_9BACT|nr:hypothetical protein Aconfl_14900 [Algoriphagus confluentis]